VYLTPAGTTPAALPAGITYRDLLTWGPNNDPAMTQKLMDAGIVRRDEMGGSEGGSSFNYTMDPNVNMTPQRMRELYPLGDGGAFDPRATAHGDYLKDPSAVFNDPTYGWATNNSNVHVAADKPSMVDILGPMAVAALTMGGSALGGGLGMLGGTTGAVEGALPGMTGASAPSWVGNAARGAQGALRSGSVNPISAASGLASAFLPPEASQYLGWLRLLQNPTLGGVMGTLGGMSGIPGGGMIGSTAGNLIDRTRRGG
jgi:hypothetical protein